MALLARVAARGVRHRVRRPERWPLPTSIHYYHFDGLGSVIALTNSAGSVVNLYEYSVYGEVSASDPNHPNRFLFTGREFDKDTGLYYYRARYYNPYIGRFLQTDPIGYGDGMNWYAYCKNNPVVFVDPSGKGLLEDIWGDYVAARDDFVYAWNAFVADVKKGIEDFRDEHPVVDGALFVAGGVWDGCYQVADGISFNLFVNKEVWDAHYARYQGDAFDRAMTKFSNGLGSVSSTCVGGAGGVLLIRASPVYAGTAAGIIEKLQGRGLRNPTLFDWSRAEHTCREAEGHIFTKNVQIMARWAQTWETMANAVDKSGAKRFLLWEKYVTNDNITWVWKQRYAENIGGFTIWCDVVGGAVVDAGRNAISGGR